MVSHTKPRLPDASVNASDVANDNAEIGKVGGGGVEFLPYYLYGGLATPSTWDVTPVDWSIYGFRTNAFNKILKVAAQAHIDSGLIMDMSLGPSQGSGVPAPYGTPGLAWNLVS